MNAAQVMLNVVFFGGCVIDWYCILRRPAWADEYDFYFGPVYVVLCFIFAVRALIQHDGAFCGVMSAYCLIGAWSWWHNDRHKRRRKKLLDRAAGVVRDAGGRLKVVRPAEE